MNILSQSTSMIKIRLEQSLTSKLSKLVLAQTIIKEKIEYLDNLKFKINR